MLRLQQVHADLLHEAARTREVETCFIGLAMQCASAFVVRELKEIPEFAYLRRTATRISVKPEYCIEAASRARKTGAGVVFAHTHLGESAPASFSADDDEGELPLHHYLAQRVAGATHFSCVATATSLVARSMPLGERVRLSVVGPNLSKSQHHTFNVDMTYDRQIRAFGDLGQRAMESLVICIVGLGGTGSLVAQQLAHLGVRRFILIDPDVVEHTNLNRVVGARSGDVGRAKVHVAADMITRINPGATAEAVLGDIRDAEVQAELKHSDLVFCCTDSMASRAILNLAAYAYYVPCIDMGVGIGAEQGKVKHIAGRVQFLSPGCACLVCTEKLDSNQVRQELMTKSQRAADPYITGAFVPQPAVISVNSTVASAAVTMFLAATTGLPSNSRMLSYDGLTGAIRFLHLDPRPGCLVCSEAGAMGTGDTCTLPKRRAEAANE